MGKQRNRRKTPENRANQRKTEKNKGKKDKPGRIRVKHRKTCENWKNQEKTQKNTRKQGESKETEKHGKTGRIRGKPQKNM